MKSYEKTIETVFSRGEQEIQKNRKRKKAGIVTAATLCCACLIVPLGMNISQTANLTEPQVSSAPDGVASLTQNETEKTNQPGGQKTTEDVNHAVVPVSSETQDKNENGVVQGPCIGTGDEKTEIGETVPFISRFPGGNAEGDYPCPENGTKIVTPSLWAAMEQYGDDAVYLVRIDLVKTGEEIKEEEKIKAEFERLSGLGYTAVLETFTEGRFTDHEETTYSLSLHAKKDQILNFAASEKYGYILSLADEEKESSGETVVFNGFMAE